MLNKARIDSPAFGQYEPIRAKASIMQRFARLWTGVVSRENIGMAVMALLLGRAAVFGELAPFGIAFFVVLRFLAPERSLLAAGGLLLGAALRAPGAAISLLGSMAIFLSLERYVLGKRLASTLTASCLAVLSCLLVKLPIFMVQPPSLFDLTSTALESGLVVALVYVFSYNGRWLSRNPEHTLPGEQALALSIMSGAMLIGLDGISLYGIPLKGIAACYLIMTGAYVGGAGLGAAAGATMGVILNLSNPALLGQVGLYAFAGMLAGLFKDMRKVGVALSFTLALMLLTVYGNQPLHLAHLGYQAGIAGFVFLLTARRFSQVLTPYLSASKEVLMANHGAQVDRAERLIANRLKELGAVFAQLAETFGEKGDDEGFLVEKNFTALMDNLVGDVCEKCSNFQVCWQQEFYRSYHVMLNTLALADTHGELDPARIPTPLRERCNQPKELITSANYLVKVYKTNLYWQKKMRESRSLVVDQLRGVSGIMRSLANDIKMDAEYGAALVEEIKGELASLKLFVPQVDVFKRKGRVDVVLAKPACPPDKQQCIDDLIPLVSNVVGYPVTRMHGKCSGKGTKGKCTLCLSTGEPLSYTTGLAQLCRAGSGISGDTAKFEELPNGKLAVLLSDGMGNGPQASRESRATVAILEQLLRSGFDQETAVQTINSVLLLRSPRESFATVDMALVDLYGGEAELVKIGASAAFLKRGSHVDCIRSSSLPAGILHKIEVDSYRVDLQENDILVMVTDGVLDAQKDVADKEDWFKRVLGQANINDPDQLAKYLLDRASMNAQGKASDDMTVAVVRVTKKASSVPLVS